MTDIPLNIRLRPTRIGFLVRPTDLASVRKIMRANACLWGGIYNPIIPVFRIPPKQWKPERFERVKGLAVAKGYVEFYEPDVFVEAEEGLLEKVGLGALREKHGLKQHIVSLKEFLIAEDSRDWSEPKFGLTVVDVFQCLYESEHRFLPRDRRHSLLVKSDRSSGLVEAVFGAYPTQKDAAYIQRAYKSAFAPTEVEATPDTWLEVYKRGALTPLLVTGHSLGRQRSWYHDITVCIFDPTRPIDLIDCWNLRLEPNPVIPVPIDWAQSLLEPLEELLRKEHRPVKGSPSGIMHHATVEIARSVSKNRADEVVSALGKRLPQGAFAVRWKRSPVWTRRIDDWTKQFERMEVTAEERRASVAIKNEGKDYTASFETLCPDFASRYGGHDFRWVNCVSVSTFGASKVATVLPFNLSDRRWPRLATGEWISVGTEGWVFGQKSKNWTETMHLITNDEAVIGYLATVGIKAALSEPGHIAKQMLEHLGDLWSVHLLKDIPTIQLLNKMAGGLRRKANETDQIEESFERRSAPIKEWIDLISRRVETRILPKLELADFTKRNIIQLGLKTDCPHCHVKNWHSLTVVDYRLRCERCLNHYEFPQTRLRKNNENWAYRVIGPFSVHDYGRGSYGSLLTLRTFDRSGGSMREMSYSTALKLTFDSVEVEVDFIALCTSERYGTHIPPTLVLGETKSLGEKDSLKSGDLAKLRILGRKLPGAVIVISILRDRFTESEKNLLRSFVNWARRLNNLGRPTNPVILLTAHELFAPYTLNGKWKELGNPHSAFADYEHIRTLDNLANATQKIYLDLPSFYEWREEKWKKRHARKKRHSGATA